MKNYPHSRMLEEVLFHGYELTYKHLNVYIIESIGNKLTYQVFNEKTSDSKTFNQIKEAVEYFSYQKSKLNDGK